MVGLADIKAGQAYVELVLKDDKLDAGLKKGIQKLQNFGAAVTKWGAALGAVGASITGPILEAVHKFASAGDALNKFSQRTGVSQQALAELGFAAEKANVEMDTFETSLKKMQKLIGTAFEGNEEAIETLAKLGVTIDQLKGKSPDKQFEIIADGLARVKDRAEKTTLALALFGRGGTAVLPMISRGGKGVAEDRAEAREKGIKVNPQDLAMATRLAEAWRELEGAMGRFWKGIGAAAAGPVAAKVDVMISAVNWAKKWVGANRELFATLFQFGTILTGVGTALTTTGLGMMLVGTALKGLLVPFSLLGSLLGVVLSPLGLIVTALGTGTAIWLNFTDSGQRAASILGKAFQKLSDVAFKALGGISDAIRAGDFKLAGDIAMTALKVSFLTGMGALADVVGGEMGQLLGKLGAQIAGGDLTGAWTTAVSLMGDAWGGFSHSVVQMFTTAMDEILAAWRKATTEISNWILENSKKGGFLGRFLTGTSGGNIGAGAGAVVGAATGARFGSAFGPWGTAIGSAIGGAYGAYQGSAAGEELLGKGGSTGKLEDDLIAKRNAAADRLRGQYGLRRMEPNNDVEAREAEISELEERIKNLNAAIEATPGGRADMTNRRAKIAKWLAQRKGQAEEEKAAAQQITDLDAQIKAAGPVFSGMGSGGANQLWVRRKQAQRKFDDLHSDAGSRDAWIATFEKEIKRLDAKLSAPPSAVSKGKSVDQTKAETASTLDPLIDGFHSAMKGVEEQAKQNAKAAREQATAAGAGGNEEHKKALGDAQAELDALGAKAKAAAAAHDAEMDRRRNQAEEAAEGGAIATPSKDVFGTFSAAALVAGGGGGAAEETAKNTRELVQEHRRNQNNWAKFIRELQKRKQFR